MQDYVDSKIILYNQQLLLYKLMYIKLYYNHMLYGMKGIKIEGCKNNETFKYFQTTRSYNLSHVQKMLF
jgi:hypothetical protein